MLKLIGLEIYADGKAKVELCGTVPDENPLRGDSVTFTIWLPKNDAKTIADFENEALKRAREMMAANPF
jgi:hypothetical protein